jgi:hypothetical protein
LWAFLIEVAMPKTWVDLTGKRINRVTVIEDKKGQGSNPRIKVRCDCGTVFNPFKSSIKYQTTKSCGQCGLVTKGRPKPHRLHGTRLYEWWVHYFKRGELAPEWMEPDRMAKDVGTTDVAVKKQFEEKKLGPDNFLTYEKKWPGRLIQINGETKNMADWAEVLGVSRQRAKQLADAGHLEERVIQYRREEKVW